MKKPMSREDRARLGGFARARSLSGKARVKAARKAVRARWARYYARKAQEAVAATIEAPDASQPAA